MIHYCVFVTKTFVFTIKTINTNTYEIGEKAGDDFYKDVLQAIENYITENPEALTMKKDEFVSLMNEVSDGSYGELVVPAANHQGIQTEVAKQATDIGFATKENLELPKIENIQDKIQTYAVEEDTTPRIAKSNANTTPVYSPKATLNDYAVKYGSFKGFAMYAKEVGVLNAIKEACKNLKNTDKVQVKKTVKRQNTNTQAKLVKSSGVSSIDNLLSWVREDAIKKLEGTILGTTYASKALEEANEKLQEKASV